MAPPARLFCHALLACLVPRAAAYKYVVPDALEMAQSTAGHTTYRLVVELINGAESIYSIIGSHKGVMEMPPAFQVSEPFGANVGGVNPRFLRFQPQAAFDSWLTVGITTGDKDSALSTAGITGWATKWSETRGFIDDDAAVFWMDPTKTTARSHVAGKQQLIVLAQITVKKGWKGKAAMGIVGHTNFGREWRENEVSWGIGCPSDLPAWMTGISAPPPSPPKGASDWPKSYVLTGKVHNIRDYSNAAGEYLRTQQKCDGVPVYRRNEAHKNDERSKFPLFLYRRPHGAHGSGYWTIGETHDATGHQSSGPDFNCNTNMASFDTSGASSCTVSPDAPGCECQWRECKGYDCFVFPKVDEDWGQPNAGLSVVDPALSGSGH